jgi:hypothetical protein
LDESLLFRSDVVHLILAGEPEKALELLSQHYKVAIPELKVGLPKGHSKCLGLYVANSQNIYVLNSECLCSPYIIIHEFYHHLRMKGRKHKGTEKDAQKFAGDFVRAYQISRLPVKQ